jgi:hypothetical protein
VVFSEQSCHDQAGPQMEMLSKSCSRMIAGMVGPVLAWHHA